MKFLDDENPQWYAVRVFHRREKYAVARLQQDGYEAWTPIIKKLRQYPTKKRVVDLPLISQYIFVYMTPDLYAQILSYDSIIAFLNTDNVILPVTEREIDIMRRVSGEEREVTISTEKLERGDKVEIIGGDLTGIEGELISFKGKNTIAIALTAFGSHMLIEVPPDNIQKL